MLNLLLVGSSLALWGALYYVINYTDSNVTVTWFNKPKRLANKNERMFAGIFIYPFIGIVFFILGVVASFMFGYGILTPILWGLFILFICLSKNFIQVNDKSLSLPYRLVGGIVLYPILCLAFSIMGYVGSFMLLPVTLWF